jgi:hypothetical protein
MTLQGEDYEIPLSEESLNRRLECVKGDYPDVPEWIIKDILEYGWQCKFAGGHFFTALLKNDFADVCTRADLEMRAHFHDLALILYNRIPAACWGSEEKIKEWLNKKGDTTQVLDTTDK